MLKETGLNLEYEKGETIGLLYIPKLDREIPIIEGTDEEELDEGVGHYLTQDYQGKIGKFSFRVIETLFFGILMSWNMVINSM